MSRPNVAGAALLVVASLLWGLACSAPAGAEEVRWRGPDGAPLPFRTDAEILGFLRSAEVVKRERVPQGINRPLKVRLSRNGVEAHAIFRTVSIRRPRHSSGGQVYLDFHDSYVYECAAYELSRLLGIGNVPPCVERQLGKNEGTLQLWIENAMTEEKRRRMKEKAPSSIDWVRQQQTMRLFDALIFNFDRNQGNMLIDPDWKLWFIDHTRSFHKSSAVERLDRVIWCERGVWEKLVALDREQLVGRLGSSIEPERIDHLLERRDVLLRHLRQRIAEMGESAVLYDAGQPGSENVEDRPDFALASSDEDIPEESSPVEEDEEGDG